MDTNRVFSVLLGITVVVSVLVVLFNTVLQPEFPVTIRYKYPLVEQNAASALEPLTQQEETVKTEDTPSAALVEETLPQNNEQLPESIRFPLELNTATKEELMLIPKVGEITASRIIAYRQELGEFTAISQLLNIKGIGDTSFATISAYVYVRGDVWDQERNLQ